MQQIKISLWIASFITAIIIPIFIFNSMTFNPDNYKAQFSKLDIYNKEPEASGIANEILNFFNGKDDLLTERLTLAEKAHLADVKRIFDNLRIIMYSLVGLLLFIFFIIIKQLRAKNKAELKHFLAQYFLISAIILFAGIIFLSLAVLNFPEAFQAMHEIIFPQGNYMFPESSTLITLFPEKFFVNFAWQLVVNITLISLFLFVLSLALRKLY